MITEDYVSYEVAKLLKEKGFDELCDKKYNGYKSIVPAGKIIELWQNSEFDVDEECSSPTLQTAMKWLREVHKLHITILWDCGACIGKNSFCYHIDRIDNYEDKGYNKIGFDSNEEAVEAAIKYCLENLI